MKKSRKPTESIWSPRSQKSMLHQLELEAKLGKCREQIAFSEKKIAQEKETAASQTAVTTDGGSHNVRLAMNRTLAGIEERKRELAAFREREKSLQAQIRALALSSAEAANRASLQGELAALVMKRFGIDAAIDAVVEKLRAAAQQRAELSAEIVRLAGRLEFAATADFDEARFAAILNSLPEDVAARSHDWVNWFFGQESARELHTVGAMRLIIAETLASAGVFRLGETAMLTRPQIANLPPDESAKRIPTPQEMEEAVAPVKPAPMGDLEVQGFPTRALTA